MLYHINDNISFHIVLYVPKAEISFSTFAHLVPHPGRAWHDEAVNLVTRRWQVEASDVITNLLHQQWENSLLLVLVNLQCMCVYHITINSGIYDHTCFFTCQCESIGERLDSLPTSLPFLILLTSLHCWLSVFSSSKSSINSKKTSMKCFQNSRMTAL